VGLADGPVLVGTFILLVVHAERIASENIPGA
jgi:hypothetical protein